MVLVHVVSVSPLLDRRSRGNTGQAPTHGLLRCIGRPPHALDLHVDDIAGFQVDRGLAIVSDSEGVPMATMSPGSSVSLM
jgi:hypothetical protein